MALDIIVSGVEYLGVPVRSPARGTALTRILALKGSPGWHAAPPSIREWRFAGIAERAGGTVLYGPWVPSRSLASVLELRPVRLLLSSPGLPEALALLKERSIPLFPPPDRRGALL